MADNNGNNLTVYEYSYSKKKEMKALKALKEHRARRGSDEEEEETEETIWKPENGKGQQKVWSLRDSGDDFAMFSFKIGT